MRTADEIRKTAPAWFELCNRGENELLTWFIDLYRQGGRCCTVEHDAGFGSPFMGAAQDWSDTFGLPLLHYDTVLYDPPDELAALQDEMDNYKHEAIALRSLFESLTVPCPDCAKMPKSAPGIISATCGKPGCYAGRVRAAK